MRQYVAEVVFECEEAVTLIDTTAGEASSAATSAAREAWWKDTTRGECEGLVKVTDVDTRAVQFFRVSVEPDVDVHASEEDAAVAAKDIEEWGQLDRNWHARVAEMRAAKPPREQILGISRRLNRAFEVLNQADIGRLSKLAGEVATLPDHQTLTRLCAALIEIVGIKQRIDRLVAELPPDP